MKNIIIFRTLLFVFLGGRILAGCGGDANSGDSGGFKVQLNNASSLRASSLSSLTTPLLQGLSAATSLAAKLGGVDLLSDCTGGNPPGTCLDSGIAPDPDIWINAGCNNDIAQCTTSNTEFFELIDPTAANVILSSQGRSIEPGNFTHVRIYLLNNDASDALECDGAAVDARPAIPIVVELPSALTVTEGEGVTVTLNYDPSSVDCADGTSISNAISAMTATATKN